MNPHALPNTSPLALVRSCWKHRQLLYQLVVRDVAQRYRGSMLGLLWSLFQPLLMLLIYTFVFSTVMKVRWTAGSDSKTEFAFLLFAGLCMFGLFADIVNRAPRLVLEHASYVKRVVFPLEILVLMVAGSALFNFVVQVAALLAVQLLVDGRLPWTVVLLPLVVLPLLLFSIGVGWFLASISVYLRDVAPLVALVTTALMFLSPVFYSAESVPEPARHLLALNPLTVPIKQARDVLIWGHGVDAGPLLLGVAVLAAVAWAGYWWFQRTRRGFADVL